MIRTAIALALATSPALALAQTPAPQLSLDHRMLVRCSAAFAIAARAQESGDAAARRWPDLAMRGREFFVRASARVMDEAGLDRSQIQAVLSAEAEDIRDNGSLGDVMPVCLTLLPAE